MGYYVDQIDSSFFIEQSNKKHALEAIKALVGKETIDDASGRHFSWVDNEFANCQNLSQAMLKWRWDTECDSDDNVASICFTGSKLGDDKILFDAIAPFVKAGSFIKMQGEEGEVWEWVFDGKECLVQEGEKERHVFASLMEEFLASAPEITVKCDDDDVNRAVQAVGNPHDYIVQSWNNFLIAKSYGE